MLDIQKEIKNLKEQISKLILNISNDKKFNGYDIESSRNNTLKAQNTADSAKELATENEGCVLEVADIVSENDGAILDVAEITSENDGAVMELAEYISNLEVKIENLEQRIGILEGGNA